MALNGFERRGVVVDGDVEEIATAILATMHGIAALIAAGLLDPAAAGATLTATVGRLSRDCARGSPSALAVMIAHDVAP